MLYGSFWSGWETIPSESQCDASWFVTTGDTHWIAIGSDWSCQLNSIAFQMHTMLMLRSPYDYSTRKKRQDEILELIHFILSRSHVIFKLTRLSYPMNIICRLCIVIREESRNFTAWFLSWWWCNSMFLFLWRLFVTENSGWVVNISKFSPLVPMHRLADLPPEDLRRSLILIPSVGAANSDKTFIFWWGWSFGRWFLQFFWTLKIFQVY